MAQRIVVSRAVTSSLGLLAAGLAVSPGIAARTVNTDELGTPAILATKGYTEIRNIASRYERDIVEACRGGRRYLMIVSRGENVSEAEVGVCAQASSAKSRRGAQARAEDARHEPPAVGVAYREDREAGADRWTPPPERNDPTRAPRPRSVPPIFRSVERPAQAPADRWKPSGGGANAEDVPSRPERAELPDRPEDFERASRPERFDKSERDRAPADPIGGQNGGEGLWRAGAAAVPRSDRTAGPLAADDIQAALRGMNYFNISIVEDRAPVYIAEVCRDQGRYRIALDRSGRVMDKEEIGPCYRKVLGIGLDDVQGALRRFIGCEASTGPSHVSFRDRGLRLHSPAPFSFGASLSKAGQGMSAITVNSITTATPLTNVLAAAAVPTKALTAPAVADEQPLPASPTSWDHNGSKMELVRDGGNIALVYRQPRPWLKAMNITEGTPLFTGVVKDKVITGLAATFSSRCPMKLFPVSGAFSDDMSRLELKGMKPAFGAHCEDDTPQQETLAFVPAPETVAAAN